jgi:hypothetical protein
MASPLNLYLAFHIMAITNELYVKLGMEVDHDRIYKMYEYCLQINIYGYGNDVNI